MKKHLIIIGVVTFLLLIMQPTKPVKAETVGDFIVTGGILDTDYSYDSVNYILKVMTGEPIDIKNINPEIPTDNRIEVVVGNVANITLSGVNIKALMSPFVIQETATLNLILAEGTTNNLIGDSYDPTGLVVKASASLTIGGTGTLKAAGVFNGSGIGGEKYEKNGDITINSGTIIAIGIRGAGIGSGGNNTTGGSNTNGNITINGGTILAYSKLGAGIGTGFGSGQGTPGAIEINGGKVTAIGVYYNGANSGIGNGVGSTVCGQVTISKEASIIAIGSGRSYGAITAPLGTGSTANILEAEFTNYIYSGCMFDVRDSSGVTSVTNYTFNNNPLDNSYINEGRSIAISVPDAGNYTLYKDNEKQQGTKDTIKSDLFHVATGLNLWKSVSNPYTVTWKSQDGATTLETDSSVEYGDTVSYDGEVPTKAADVQYTYTFTGWATSANAESGTIAGSLPTVSGDTTYYATFSKRIRSYSVTWKSQDGAITLETDNSVNYGMAPTYDGTTPTKAADAQYTYTFAGWATTANAESGTAAGSLPTISGDTTYYAAFSKTVKNYSVIWKSQDGATTLETDSNVNNGTEPSYDGTTPTKAADAQYTYTFAGWATSANTQSGTIAGSLPKVSGDTTYYAAFSKTVRSYSVIWKSQDGATTLEEDASVNYGTAPTYDGTTPTKAADAQYTYTFAGWATSANAESGTAAVSLPTVNGDTIYYAAFSKTVRSYSVTWKSQDGATTLETDSNVNNGTAPSYNGTTPMKAADAQYTYTFAGWATFANAQSGTIAVSLSTVSADTIYYAAFSKTVRSYSVTWKSQDGATTLEAYASVNYGTASTYDGTTPTKAADAQYTYTFAGWATSANAQSGTAAVSLPTVSGNTTYYAAFSKTLRSYSVTWKSQDGVTTLETDNSVNYGTAPSYNGKAPTKAADAQYTYTFAGWATSANAESGTIAGSLPTVNGATTYYAAFSRMKITYPDGSGTGSYTPTTIKPAGTIKKDQQSEEGSPVATINNSVDNLKASVFTAEEREKVAAGEDAKVTLQIKDISTSVSDTDKKLVEEKQINELQSSDQQNSATQNTAPTVLYVDISLLKQIGSGQVIKVTETSSMISISIEVPQSLWNTDNNNSRTYRVVRVHDSAVDILEGTYDPTTHLFTFETDRFSTYALTYQDESRATPENSAGTTVKPTAYQDFNHLRLTAKATKTSQKLTYAKVSKADGYLIYGAQCGQEMKKLADVESTITSYTVNKLKQGTNYKYQVKAYQLIDGKQVIIMTSNVIHSVTEGKIYANPTKVTSNTATVKLAEGKSKTVSCQVVIPKGKKLKQHTAEIRYESSNKKIATVNSNGKITAKAEGTCYVYAYAQNGVYKKIKVVVK